jgi:hypothetical protein
LVLALEAGTGTGTDSGSCSCSDTIDSESECVAGAGGRGAEEEVAVVGFLFRSSDMVRERKRRVEREYAPVQRCGSKLLYQKSKS